MEKSEKLLIRLEPHEKELLRRASYKSGMSMTDFVRETTLKVAELIATGKRDQLEKTMKEIAASLYSASV